MDCIQPLIQIQGRVLAGITDRQQQETRTHQQNNANSQGCQSPQLSPELNLMASAQELNVSQAAISATVVDVWANATRA